ncbi:4Fe-4S binding protein [Entomobacter blattae]|uniref:Electron transport complex subunit RsxB n=1 Tax=Entomobacter blattae TaxID=2762277 RepID=A0A7H1NT20_9PROT|nr:4Fe-4S binding protein [Entomobacter blattae]QNT78930.1 Electron transport complex subunit RsxB [Entomobacter blattae]
METALKDVLICHCHNTISTDLHPLSLPGKSITHCQELCKNQLSVIQEKLKRQPVNPLLIGCTQFNTLFLSYAEKISTDIEAQNSASPIIFANIREYAGWSVESEQALPKITALLEAESFWHSYTTRPSYLQEVIPFSSSGRTLFIGKDFHQLIALAKQAQSLLSPEILLWEEKWGEGEEYEIFSTVDFPLHKGKIFHLAGVLGKFSLDIRSYSQAQPFSRHVLQFTPPQEKAILHYDMVFDLRGEPPLFQNPRKHDGYFYLSPDEPAAIQKGLFEAASLVGEFEKPRYISFTPSLCAHSRSHKQGCTRCLERCQMSAIAPEGDAVTLDAELCAGCGSCSAVCPSGAIQWAEPVEGIIQKLRVLIQTYLKNGGKTPPVILFISQSHGSAIIEAMARAGKGLPAHVIPVLFSHVPSAEVLLAPLVYGARQVLFLTGKATLMDQEELKRVTDLARVFLLTMGYPEERVELCFYDDPFDLEEKLYTLPQDIPAPQQDFFPIGTPREILRASLEGLLEHAPHSPHWIPLPPEAPFGKITVEEECTLCLSCVSACPASALQDSPEHPALLFNEEACIQCGLCQAVCPERVISLQAGYTPHQYRKNLAVLKEEEPAECISCGKPFGTRSSIEKVIAKLSGQHSAFQNTDMINRIRMCAECRIKDHFGHNHSLNPEKKGSL